MMNETMNGARDEPANAANPFGAFVPGPRATAPASGDGALTGRTLAVKDLFDVAGFATTYGNPDWARTHPPAAIHAPIVTALLEAGARLVGKTVTVELAYGLNGVNVWHGTPINPRATDRLPGGSSCGSAAAVAGRVADFALGSDTGGSVRIPASYCGLFGIRPTQGAISLAGACALAPSMDTPGWFARDAGLMVEVGDVLLPETTAPRPLGPLLRPEEAWDNAEPEVAEALRPALAAVEALLGPALAIRPMPEGPAALNQHYRAVQAQEAWAALGGWIEATRPAFGPGGTIRFAYARAVPPAEAAAGRAFRRMLRARLQALLGGGAVLVFPTSPGPAPLLTASDDEQEDVRRRTMAVTAIASLCGLCEVTLPVATVAGGAPVGLSLAAAPGQDRPLLALAARLARALSL